MTSNGLQMPPDEAWIERRAEFVIDTEQSRTETFPGQQTRRIIGNLRGAWPNHGRVRLVPSGSGDVVITEAELAITPDGTVR